MIRILISASTLALAGACTTSPHDSLKLDGTAFMEAVPLADDREEVPAIEAIEPVTMPGQLKPLTEKAIGAVPALKPYEAIDKANASAAIEPDATSFINAIQLYPFTAGALYQIYTAPEQVTDIALQPGEELISVSAGDTARWVLGDTISGAGEASQTHILVKPVAAGLKTNLIITTSRRTYHIEMTSFAETYMAAVSWRYPHEELIKTRNAASRNAQQQTVIARGLSLDRLNFRYEITGDRPHWRPLRAFDDGRKVFIQFPARLDQGEAPPLFIVGRNGDTELVNYRINGAYYIVDRLFAAAELRLGEKTQEVVRIERTGAPKNRIAGR